MNKLVVQTIVGKSDLASLDCLDQDVKLKFVNELDDVCVKCVIDRKSVSQILCDADVELKSDFVSQPIKVVVYDLLLNDAKVASVRKPLTIVRLNLSCSIDFEFKTSVADVKLHADVSQLLIDAQLKVVNSSIDDCKHKISKPFICEMSYVADNGSLHKRDSVDSELLHLIESALGKSITMIAAKCDDDVLDFDMKSGEHLSSLKKFVSKIINRSRRSNRKVDRNV